MSNRQLGEMTGMHQFAKTAPSPKEYTKMKQISREKGWDKGARYIRNKMLARRWKMMGYDPAKYETQPDPSWPIPGNVPDYARKLLGR
jgi:hypothetical protein